MANHIEAIKLEKDGLDVLPDIHWYARAGFAAITKDDMARFKWYGLYSQVPNDGHFMLRIKIPGGILRTEQLRVIAGVTADYGHGFGDITTRQDIQMHWLTIEQTPDTFQRLRAVGLTTTEACGDCVRNVTGCPVAGIDGGEMVDAYPVIKALNEFFLGNPEYSNLPRKFKIGVTGCQENCCQADMNDIGLTPAFRDLEGRPRVGFNVRVGGGLSTQPRFASDLDAFILPEEAVEVARAIVCIFRDQGYRDRRNRSRLKFLVEDWGIERFRAAVVAQLGRDLPGAGQENRAWTGGHHMGVHRQKQDGFWYVGLTVPVGRITSAQILEVARLADTYGRGEIRLTGNQSLIVPWVADDRLTDLLAEPLLRELNPAPPQFERRVVTCTGKEFCNFGQVETKQRALRLARFLDRQFPDLQEPIRIHLTACPHSCAQYQIGDIALLGVRARINREIVDAMDISVGGGFGPQPTFATLLRRRVPDTEAEAALARLVRGWLDQRQPDESFRDWVHRGDVALLTTLLGGEPAGDTFGVGDAPVGKLATHPPRANNQAEG